MSRRSIYRASRTNTSAYGPKTDSNVQHWSYDFIELGTTREEETEGPQKANMFKVKTWVKVDNFTPLDDGVPDDKFELVNRTQAAADEIANKDEGPAHSGSETPEHGAMPDLSKPEERITEVSPDADVEMQDAEESVEPEEENHD